MTPESVVSLLHLADRFSVMVLQLLRKPMPELPLLPGRVFMAPPITTPEEDAADLAAAQAWQALADNEGADLD